MPVFAAVGAGLAALGGSSAAVGAGIAASAIGGVGSIVASSNAASAAKQAGQLQYQATQDANALQEKIYNQNRQDNAWIRDLGMTASSALAKNFGLQSSVSTGGMSGGTGGVTMTGGAQPDWNAYLTANPDVAQAATADPQGYGDFNQDGKVDQTDFAAGHYSRYGQTEGRAMPTVPGTEPDPNAPQPGYSDPSAPGGYETAARTPATPYVAPVRMTSGPLDVSAAAYQKSPGYDWQMEQGQRGLDHVASAGGGVMSGQRQKAALRFSQGLANQDYGDWRDYTTGQYNYDRAFNESTYQADRGFTYGKSTDDRNFGESTYQADRSRLDSRYDTRNNELLALSGFGQQATAQNAQSAQTFANNSSNLLMTGAQAKADATTGAASAWNQGLGNLMTLGAYAYGAGAGGGGTKSLPQATWI